MNIGNNGAVFPENIFSGQALNFQRLFVISFWKGFSHLAISVSLSKRMFCAVWLKMPHWFIKFSGGQTDATHKMISKVHLNLRFSDQRNISNVTVRFGLL